MKKVTSLTRAKFEELRVGIVDGSLAKKWSLLKDDSELTKSQRVELRQIGALLNIYTNDPDMLGKLVVDKDWIELEILRDIVGGYFLAVRRSPAARAVRDRRWDTLVDTTLKSVLKSLG